MRLIITLLACTLPPSRGEVQSDLQTRRDRSQLEEGPCWMSEALSLGQAAAGCVPGPWFGSNAEERAYWAPLDHWYRASRREDFTPEELLVIGVNTQHTGTFVGIAAGAEMQARALERGADPQLATQLARYRVTDAQLQAHMLADSLVHGTGLMVVDRGGWRERLGWERLRQAIDRIPPPSAAEWAAMVPDHGTPEAVMWPDLSVLDEAQARANAAWARVLAAPGPATQAAGASD